MQDLKITLVQSELDWEDKAANFRRFDQWLTPLKGQSDLVILPEMFTTGFSMNAAALAELPNGPTISWMAEKAQQTGAVITGSYIAKEKDHYYNRLIWMQPDGKFESYDKRHLFTLSGEEQHYRPGQQRLIVQLKGWKICPLICYDLRFPVWSRNTNHYDLLLYVANWPGVRRHAWKSLLTARAIENQTYTIGLNRVGQDANGLEYAGDSTVINYAGDVLVQLAEHEGVYTAHLSYSKQQTFRKKLAFLADQDKFDIAP
ncbi:MAG: nitrilase family protein [Saprospiraceae bacterium]|nr:MAG: nitrilase family protein [Saprospiraceae bacterium]